ncbi:phosphatase PAP2 family protein [Barrientosiimonas marina]|uniref:Phosphatase PAP2 family protein n=1 Tax=Lentibacillus kimchii TaxID=1542911 RepID=A0ABW2UUA4_9BACI
MHSRKLEAIPLILIGISCLLLFGVVAWGVYFDTSWLTSFDMSWIERIQGIVSEGKTAFITQITQLGNIRLIIALTVVMVIVLFYKRHYAEGLWLGGTILVCAAIIGKILKVIFDRDRPQFLQLVDKTAESFPSGHSLAATIFYGLIGLVIVLTVRQTWKKLAAGLLTLAWIVFLLITRIYLGAHFPSDVLAGFLYGMAVVFISVGVYLPALQPLRNLLQKVNVHDKSKLFVRERKRQS